MKVCWTAFLPILFALIFLVFLIPVSLDSLPLNGISLSIPFILCGGGGRAKSNKKNHNLYINNSSRFYSGGGQGGPDCKKIIGYLLKRQ